MCELCNVILKLYNTHRAPSPTFVLVFHRILDLKAGLDFYPGPFLFPIDILHYLKRNQAWNGDEVSIR